MATVPEITAYAPSARWFAPWTWCARWPLWIRWMVLVLVLPVGFVESGVLASAMLYHRHGYERFDSTPAGVYFFVGIVYGPLQELTYHIPCLRPFYDGQIYEVAALFDRAGISHHGR